MLTEAAFIWYKKVKTVKLWNNYNLKIIIFCCNIFYKVIYSCDQSWMFSLQCHMILQKSFRYAAQETFSINSVENSCAASYWFWIEVQKNNTD